MRLGPGLLYEGRTLQGARPKLADFCSATMAEFYSAVDTCMVLAIVLLCLFPGLATWLPNLVMGGAM
jgi:hypothetical protein